MMNQRERQFKELVSQHKDQIYRICYGYLYDRTEVHDLYQEILINIWNNLDSFRNEAKISTWIFRIAVNSALMFNRTSRRKSRVFVDREISPDQFVASDQMAEKKSKEKALDFLAYCISQLPKEDRLIIGMVLEKVSYKEISSVMGITTSHTGVKIKRIKERLSKMMEKENYEV
ncbi:MAG: RNA polymerase sigma factor [Bacteroidetes bacterium]|nr:RNA polymerase sigma factor [Bacteroidota bacterium]